MFTLPRSFVLASLTMLLLVACAPAASMPGGVQILDPWTRPEVMVMDEPAATTAMTTTMSGHAMSEHAMTGTMTGTMPETMTGTMTASMPMSHSMAGNMGMGIVGSTVAVYMTIRNTGSQPDRLLKVSSDGAQAVELHKTVEENGVMAMRPVQTIEVPANGEVALKPGSFHIMLVGLTKPLNLGGTVVMTLTFAQAGTMTVQAKVRER